MYDLIVMWEWIGFLLRWVHGEEHSDFPVETAAALEIVGGVLKGILLETP